MADKKDDVQSVAELLAKTKVEQINVVSFKGKSIKLNTADDGKFALLLNNDSLGIRFSMKMWRGRQQDR